MTPLPVVPIGGHSFERVRIQSGRLFAEAHGVWWAWWPQVRVWMCLGWQTPSYTHAYQVWRLAQIKFALGELPPYPEAGYDVPREP